MRVGPGGRVEQVAFESDSCAVSTAVADILSEWLEGAPIDKVPALDGLLTDVLDGHFPDHPRDCVIGPEAVVRNGTREFLEARGRSDSVSTENR